MKRSGTNEEKNARYAGNESAAILNAFLPLPATEKSSKSSASASLLLFPPGMSSSSSSFCGWGILTHISQHIRGERKRGGKDIKLFPICEVCVSAAAQNPPPFSLSLTHKQQLWELDRGGGEGQVDFQSLLLLANGKAPLDQDRSADTKREMIFR